MTDIVNAPDEREEIEMLLPWYVTGRLDAADRARVASWLARDAALARQLALIEAERMESIAAAEAIAPPRGLSSRRVLDSLPAPSALSRASAWLDGVLAGLSPKGLRFAAAAAVLLIAVQSVGLGFLIRSADGPGYQTASGPTNETARGTFALVRLAPSAKAADLTRLLRSMDATIASGPNADGFYRLRIGPHDIGASEQKSRVELLRGAGLFELVLQEPSRRSEP